MYAYEALLKAVLVMIMMTRWVSGRREECVMWHETMALLRENIGVQRNDVGMSEKKGGKNRCGREF